MLQLRVEKCRGKGYSDLRVSEGPDERLGSILGPVLLVVELSGVPVDLVEELAHADGVGGRAGAAGLEGAALRVRHVRHVVGRVQVLAIPARGEAEGRHDAHGARLRREVDDLRVAGVDVLEAGVGELPETLDLLAAAGGNVADVHAETLMLSVSRKKKRLAFE